jgi:pimeloyl-ACP methyl ester carboxylesterase
MTKVGFYPLSRVFALGLTITFLSCFMVSPLVSGQSFGITQSEWQGYERLDFVVAGQPAILIRPKNPASDRPWVWRAEWFGDRHAPQVSLALLERGWHLAYINASDRYGSPEAIAIFDAFYRHLRKEAELAEKVVLEGFSRGGLYAFNFAASYPERVAAIYLDAPALDLRSWPGYKKSRWAEVAACYGLTEAAMETAQVSPLDRIEPVLRAGIPIIGVSGDADKIVPYEENLAVLAKRYRAGGGLIEVIIKPGGGHLPHSLEDPTPIVDFILKHARQ